MRSFRRVTFLLALVALATLASAQQRIPHAQDRPPGPPSSPQEALKKMTVPEGFTVELVASEPLIREPSGVCWDERGQLFVSELHGYNLEGQHDIEELNRTGQLDRVVRRIQADERHKRAAEGETNPREIRERAPPFNAREPGHRSTAIGDHYLTAFLHLVEQIGEVLARFSNTRLSHGSQLCHK